MAVTEQGGQPSRSGSRRILDAVRSSRSDAPDTTAIVLHAGGNGLLAAVVGLAAAMVLTVASWAAVPHADGASAQAPIRLAAGLWLLAHHVTLELGAASLGLTPLAWTLVPLGLTYLAGRQAARALAPVTLGDVGRALVVLALAYGLVAAVVAGLSSWEAMQPHPLQAFVLGAALAFVGGGLGLLRAADLDSAAWLTVPFRLRQAAVAGTAALLSLVGVAAVVVALMLAAGFGEAVDYSRTLDAGGVGGLSLALVSASFVPTMVVWAGAFLAGPGFTVGEGTTVSPHSVDYGALPVFPPLAALPPEGVAGGAALLSLTVPLAAGVLAGWLVHRRLASATPHEAALWSLVAGAVAGVGFAVLAWWSSGPVGAQRLSVVGVSPWTGLLVAAEVGLVGAVVAWECHRRRG